MSEERRNSAEAGLAETKEERHQSKILQMGAVVVKSATTCST
jgi:hypothetical protein